MHDNLVNLSWKPHSQETPSAEPSQQEEGKGVLRDRGPDPLDKGWRPQMEKKLLFASAQQPSPGIPLCFRVAHTVFNFSRAVEAQKKSENTWSVSFKVEDF